MNGATSRLTDPEVGNEREEQGGEHHPGQGDQRLGHEVGCTCANATTECQRTKERLRVWMPVRAEAVHHALNGNKPGSTRNGIQENTRGARGYASRQRQQAHEQGRHVKNTQGERAMNARTRDRVHVAGLLAQQHRPLLRDCQTENSTSVRTQGRRDRCQSRTTRVSEGKRMHQRTTKQGIRDKNRK